MESSVIASYSTQKSNIPVADRTSNSKANGKQKEVAYHEIIDVDMDDDCDDVMILEGKFESNKKAKFGMGTSPGSSSAAKSGSKKGKEIIVDPGSNNFVDLDDYVFDDEYGAFQSSFDDNGMKKNAVLEARVSQPYRIGPMALSTMFSSTKKTTADDAVNGPSSKGSSTVKSSSRKAMFVDPDVKKRYDSFKKFDTVVDHSDHYYAKKNSELAQFQPPKNWAKKIQNEWKILEKDLPDTIYVRAYESRMDLLRAVIIGAEGTPYHDGLFFFDVCFPSSYPKSPPQSKLPKSSLRFGHIFQFHPKSLFLTPGPEVYNFLPAPSNGLTPSVSTVNSRRVHYCSGGLHINPNLYSCGKVCLSLLNTWTGGKNEKWIPSKSTMLQVLVSIQGLILNMKPYFNEPGYAPSSGTVHGEKASIQYNEGIFILSLKTMVYTMNRPPKYFEDLVIGHFQLRVRDILMACKAYTEGVQVGCLVKGGVQDVDEVNKSCSVKFKHDVGSYIKTLIAAFKKIGAKETQEFLSLSVKETPLPTAPGPAFFSPIPGPGPAFFSPISGPPTYMPTGPAYSSHGYPPFHYNSMSSTYNQHW